MNLLDYLIMLIYFAVMIGAGYWGLRGPAAPTTTSSPGGDWARSCTSAA